MVDRDFGIFDRVIGEILAGLDDADREALKRRINMELDRCESEGGSELHRKSIEIRERIRAIERKALARLGDRVVQPKQEGRRCSLCGQYESDVVLVPLGEPHAVCGECIALAKEIVDEDRDGQRSDR
jgi:hypothetical protein